MSKDLALQQTEWDLHESPEKFIPLEFTEEIKPDLFGLEISKAQEMTSGLSTTLAEREVLKNAYVDVINLEITTENLATFKELRLKIVKNRTQGIEKWHKENKAFYLAGGRFVDAIKNKEIVVNEEMESKLLEAEKFFENQEKEKARLLNLERIEKIRFYVDDADNMDFSAFDDESFDDYVLGKKTRFEANEIAKEEERIRIENERLAEIERQKAIEEENAKLKAEAEAKEKELEKERAEAKAKQDAIELKAKQEREKAEEERKIEADKQAKIQAEKDAEIKRLNDEKVKAEDERLAKFEADKKDAEKLAKAPVKKQLNVWVDSFKLPETPMTENETSKIIIEKFDAFKKWSKSEIDKL